MPKCVFRSRVIVLGFVSECFVFVRSVSVDTWDCVCYNRWVLWYYKSDKSRDWMDNLKQIVSFDTVSYSEYNG